MGFILVHKLFIKFYAYLASFLKRFEARAETVAVWRQTVVSLHGREQVQSFTPP